ncbi:MAG: hypothetical protein RL748_3820 [Pseudomonadota bacterium]|jgi:signal transduction histidine kinase
MKIDPRSVVYIIIIGSLLMSGGMFAVARGYLAQVPGVQRWAKATLMLGLGWIVSAALRGVIPEVVSVVLGNGLISLALWHYLAIFAAFRQKNFDQRWIWWGVGLQLALMTWFVLVQPHFSLRGAVYHVFLVGIMAWSGWILLSGQGWRQRAQGYTAAVCVLCALVLSIRIVNYLFFNYSADNIPFQQSLLNDVSYLVFYLVSVLLTFCYVLMCNERYFRQRADDERIVREGYERALQEQRRIDNLKSEFISVVSHELRTPLTSIRGSLGLLDGGAAGALSPQAHQLITIAHKNSQRLVSLVNDILDMEKLASGKMVLHPERLDLIVLVRQAIEANQSYAHGYGVSYQMQNDTECAWVWADGERLMQVLANLMSNAAKFSAPGQQVWLRVLWIDQRYRIEVEDHGKGIPENFRPHIFGRFAQADLSDTRKSQGAGLGLNISKSLIEKMGGEIGFDSQENCKTVFWVALPAL